MHPLRIDTITLPSGGRINMTPCPGKQQAGAATGPWARDLETDLKGICAWGRWRWSITGVPEVVAGLEGT